MIRVVVLIVMCFATPLFAVEPDEILEDPVLERRARDISKEIRCLVCQNEPIDSSDAQIARDLRLLVRERLLAGDTDDQVRTYLVDRYGEFVLLKPAFSWGNAALWGAGPLLLLIGMVLVMRMPRRVETAAGLSKEEEARVAELMKKDPH
ncbi:MAG: cytochrome c-type biogenesis protein [Pseudomonadota bacterium]